MSDCEDICVLSGEDADPAEFSNREIVKARKEHVCCECGGVIPKGSRYERTAGKWDGEFAAYSTCELCVEVRMHFSCDGSYLIGETWERLREDLFHRLRFECLDGLSVSAHEKVLDEWRKWKGLAPAPERGEGGER